MATRAFPHVWHSLYALGNQKVAPLGLDSGQECFTLAGTYLPIAVFFCHSSIQGILQEGRYSIDVQLWICLISMTMNAIAWTFDD